MAQICDDFTYSVDQSSQAAKSLKNRRIRNRGYTCFVCRPRCMLFPFSILNLRPNCTELQAHCFKSGTALKVSLSWRLSFRRLRSVCTPPGPYYVSGLSQNMICLIKVYLTQLHIMRAFEPGDLSGFLNGLI